jgi:hypothetical protein
MTAKVAILLVAPSSSFIDADLSIGPDVYFVCGWVDNGVPDLRDSVCVPFAEGVIKLMFPGS